MNTLGQELRANQRALDETAYHTYALSNRGAGDSSRGIAKDDYTIDAFARDPLVGTIWCARGGFGTTRLLPLLDRTQQRVERTRLLGLLTSQRLLLLAT